MRISDWSSDVCSSDLVIQLGGAAVGVAVAAACPVGLKAGPLFDGSPLQAPADMRAEVGVSGGEAWSLDVALGRDRRLQGVHDPRKAAVAGHALVDRKSVGEGKRVVRRGDFGWRRYVKTKKK